MKTQSKPIVALAAAALLLGGLPDHSAQAQSIIIEGPTTVNLADVNGNDSGPTALPVTYEVTQFTSGAYNGLYDYSYTVNNSSADPAYVLSFEVGFNALASGAVVGTPTGETDSESSGITWNVLISPGEAPDSQDTLAFMSDFAPVPGNANASGSDTPGPWASTPDGAQVAVPAVPEPATTSLLAMAFLIPSFGRGLFRPCNFKKLKITKV